MILNIERLTLAQRQKLIAKAENRQYLSVLFACPQEQPIPEYMRGVVQVIVRAQQA